MEIHAASAVPAAGTAGNVSFGQQWVLAGQQLHAGMLLCSLVRSLSRPTQHCVVIWH
jgi:hypothetical protein